MHNKEDVREIVEIVKEVVVAEKTDPAAQALEHEFSQFLGFPDVDQKKILADLTRLHRSLRGPEGLLDKGNYSRPFPEVQHPAEGKDNAARAKRQGGD